MGEGDQEYLEELRKHARETLALLRNERKAVRECMVVRAFLRCAGVTFSEEEIQVGKDEPVDVIFRSARFQERTLLGGRLRDKEWKDRLRRYEAAKCISDVMEPWSGSRPMPFEEVSREIATALVGKAKHYADRSRLDAIVYVNLSGRHLYPAEFALTPDVNDKFCQQGWRSVSMLFLPYAAVLMARQNAPDFLQERLGLVLHEWPHAFGWFEP
jgi:hypothetical protein